MRRYVKKLGGEEGISLIELIAAMALIAIFGGLIYSVITFGLNTYNKIEVENSLRDEADLLMSSVINDLYTIAPQMVRSLGTNGIQLIENEKESASAEKIYFENGSMHVQQGVIAIKSKVSDESSIKLVCETPGAGCRSGLIEIMLVLNQTYSGKLHQLKLESKFGF
ncbi:type II secretory pathway component PulJ [Paenibacillus castaneae]|uniref:PulJ/GspJ family protein n=1 Tax=Paenibacillus castaneae TaxID=474957 RepID=UPI000C9D1766|nr:hypothetical protein [Paenibacillus castaneae]NIK77292.1 type II secretory pathway component PulJ [Paenibacillus castaneae]